MQLQSLFTSLALVVIFSVSAFSAELLDSKALFSGDRTVCLSDGSSIYIFLPDGEFQLEPLGISGRTIKGKWKYDSDGIHIVGIWSWINGLSPKNDLREMDIHIGAIYDETTDYKTLMFEKPYKIQKAYFLIDRIQKIKEKS